MTIEPWSMVVAALCALTLMPLVIRVRTLGHGTTPSPQHVHEQPTSRLGGGIIFVAYALGVALAIKFGRIPSGPLLALLACAIPVFAAGIREDVTHSLSPRHRLIAAVLSALVASAFAGGVIARLDLPYLDDWLHFLPLALLLTCFMVAGACNAMNLIDGAHGLAAGTALLMFAGMAAAAGQVGDQFVFVQAVTMIGALAGFLAWNYPRGRVFMGDGGAYFIGFIYAELSILIVARNEGISAWFVIMLAAYPIVETLYSIYRRKIRHRTPSTEPDAWHLHSLVYRQMGLKAAGEAADRSNDRANARVAPRLWLHGLICCATALILRDNTPALIAGVIVYAMFYVVQYRMLWKYQQAHTQELSFDIQEPRSVGTD